MTLKLELHLARALKAPGGPAPGDRVVVAVSGGLDSMVLLHAATTLIRGGTLPLEVAAAHLNHGLRGASSEADERLVRETCTRLVVPLHVDRVHLETGPSLENRARSARRRFFREIAHRVGARHVLLAHTADDQAETVLSRFLAGAGPDGLQGMRRLRPLEEGGRQKTLLMRPLLGITRAAVEAHARDRDIPFREDESNRDRRFRRNRLRHEVLPFLRSRCNPTLDRTLVRLGSLMEETADLLEETAARALATVLRPAWPGLKALVGREEDEVLCLDRKAFRRLSPGLRSGVLRLAIRRLRPDGPPVPGRIALEGLIRRVVGPGGSTRPWRVRKGLHAAVDGEVLLLCRFPLSLNGPPETGVSIVSGEVFEIPSLGLRARATLRPLASGEISTRLQTVDSDSLVLNADRVEPGAEFRFPRGGEPFIPRGRRRPVMLLHYLKKRGIPAYRRLWTPVIASRTSGEVHAIWGIAVSAGAGLTPTTTTVLEVSRVHS